ncbi:FUSC family protein [Longimicrobium sp.]|uniref:FUSC family protein n=1 Tax=Longimicrobium sp. TaxID=2029185 RepID=UPI002E30EAD2|nr:FUSC family protein [Longimicrobium sp.]HEX6040976.1 FUSC family protein [Longimicrobium sp.]
MLRGLYHRLLAADPGLQRTYVAGRTTLSVALTLALLFPLAKAAGQPPTVGLLGVSVAMPAALAITGLTAGEQLRTAALALLIAGVSVTLGALVSPHPLLGYAGFVAVMAAAAWAGGYGPRWRGLGMVGFMTFFFALFTQAHVDRLPWLLMAVTTGIGVSAIVRVLLLRDSPHRRLRRLLVALRARTRTLALHAADPRRRAALADQAVRVDEAVLPLHDLLRDTPETVPEPRRFQRHLFAVVTLSHLRVLQATEGRDAPAAALALPPFDPAERMRGHLDALDAVVDGRPEPELPGARDGFEEDAPEGEGGLPALPTPQPAPPPPPAQGATRTALQVAVAGAAAIAIGHLLSPHRWYWAAIAAYIVFVNTSSRGATLRRAVERTVGTAAGIVGGMLAGYLLAGRGALELLIIFPLLFVGYWMLQTSQVAMVGMITILFALMYDLMGMLTLHVMLLRLAETAVGAMAGAVAAYFIFPERTTRTVDDAFAGWFGAVDGLLDTLAAAAGRPAGADASVLNAVHGLDRATGGLRTALLPLTTGVPGRRSRALQRQMVLALTARYWINRLVARVLFHTAPVDEGALRRQIPAVRGRMAALREGRDPVEPPMSEVVTEGAPLARADALLAELARARAQPV